MYRGTTPTHTFTLPEGLADIVPQVLFVTYKQKGKIVLEKNLNDVVVKNGIVKLTLTQEETLMFEDNRDVSIQIRLKTAENKAFASEIMKCSVKEVLKDGVI